MKKLNIKVITIIGTRPEIIRLSRIISLLDQTLDHKLVHTGQNYDYELNEIFFNDLELRSPDYYLNVDTSSIGTVVGDIIKKSEEVFLKEKPDAVLVLGDTNSCLSAYIAKRMHIPIYHMEAGNRCFDFNVPEEINRRIIDHIADFNLVYTEHARRHLISEGYPHRRIYLTGSPLYEVFQYYLPKIEKSNILEKLNLTKDNYFLVSIHREENVDNFKNLNILLDSLIEIKKFFNKRIIITTHPRTRKRLSELLGNNNNNNKNSKAYNEILEFHKPFGFLDYNKLQMNALCVLSDSGTITEESSILNFPAITLRNSIERPEGIDTGSIILTGINKENIIDAIKLVLFEKEKGFKKEYVPEYKVTNTSMRVVKLIVGTAKLSNKWWGIEF